MTAADEIHQHNKREKIVTDSVIEFSSELNGLFYKNDQGQSPTSTRMQLIGCFSIIDVLANYWFRYLGHEEKQSIRFKEFVREFCFTDNNNYYKEDRDVRNMTIDDFYTFRCGLVHFYGISVKNVIIADSKIGNEKMEGYKQAFKKVRPDLIFIQPIVIKNIIYKGTELMLLKMMSNIEKAQSDKTMAKVHMDGINRIFEKMYEEGAALVPEEKMDDIKSKIR